jgi:hypothetical protein
MPRSVECRCTVLQQRVQGDLYGGSDKIVSRGITNERQKAERNAVLVPSHIKCFVKPHLCQKLDFLWAIFKMRLIYHSLRFGVYSNGFY